MDLPDYLEVLAYDIALWMTAYQDASYPLEQLGDVTESVIAKLRAAAIIVLLTRGDTDGFYHNLMRAARCRLQYLQRCAAEARQAEHHQCSSRLGGFLAAVAAADYTTARQIIALSPVDWLKGHEYEDDYCYAQLLHGLLAVQPDSPRLQALLQQMDTALDGREDARLILVKAIVARDQGAFAAAMDAFVAARTNHLDADEARHRIEEPVMLAERHVYVEGLAMLRIAERLGLAVQTDYLYLPSLARLPMQRAFPGE
jgi:hypothetical protein